MRLRRWDFSCFDGRFVAAATILFAASVAVAADAVPAVASKNACLTCHAVDKKIVGPAFQAVAQKYRNDNAAQASIEGSVRKGSTGKWGAVPMPPNPTVKEDDLKKLSAWILSL